MWMLRIEPGSFRRATNALNHWTISPDDSPVPAAPIVIEKNSFNGKSLRSDINVISSRKELYLLLSEVWGNTRPGLP